ncbi:MAG TPA: EF-P lysine aminoacylase EpmA [Gammaproteobacteria bacterium]|nr:EF-P lysine aminoacylase EpmA [Gammaproteobacteria bacterium]
MNGNWQPTATRAALALRAQLLKRIRQFFEERDVLEVETPMLSRAAATDLHLHSIPAAVNKTPAWLHTSPEYPMKRLLAAGYGDIYQVCKVFRDGESGRYHNPEFTLVEWYRHGFDHHRLMEEVGQLLQTLLGDKLGLVPPQTISYEQAFVLYAGFNPHSVSRMSLEACAASHDISYHALNDSQLMDLIGSHIVYPRLGKGGLLFLYDFPVSQAALARIRPGSDSAPAVAERFEVFLNGMELANGFYELTDAAEQRQRFEADNRQRQHASLPMLPLDENLLAAMEAGLPDCSGVALGFDRVVMLAAGVDNIQDVLAFPIDRA